MVERKSTLCNVRSLISHGQHDSPVILNENGGYQKLGVDCNQQRNLAIYLLKRKITVTAEYLPGSINVETDRESRQTRDSSEWKLNSSIFMKLCQIRRTPQMDLFASRVSHQLPQCISWKINPFRQSRGAVQISWADKFVYAFPPFPLIGRVLQKVN